MGNHFISKKLVLKCSRKQLLALQTLQIMVTLRELRMFLYIFAPPPHELLCNVHTTLCILDLQNLGYSCDRVLPAMICRWCLFSFSLANIFKTFQQSERFHMQKPPLIDAPLLRQSFQIYTLLYLPNIPPSTHDSFPHQIKIFWNSPVVKWLV